jgi:hypothetical protein
VKKLILIVLILTLFPVTINAGYLGIHKASENITMWLIEPLDQDGKPRKPDSVHVQAWRDDHDSACYHITNTTYPFTAAGIDTCKSDNDTTYVFRDQIQDIDGTAGNFGLAIKVIFFCDTTPTATHGYVQVIEDSLNKQIVTTTYVGTDAIEPGDLKTGAIDADAVADGAIDAGAIATDAIGSAEIAENAIGASEVADNTIDAGAIAENAITASELATDAIGAAEIAAGAIVNGTEATGFMTEALVESNCEDAIGDKFLFNGDSVIIDQSTRVVIGDTNSNPFNNTTDSVFQDMSTLFARMAADSVPVNLLPGVIDSTSFDTASIRDHYETYFIFEGDTLVVDQSTMVAVGDTNKVQGATTTQADDILDSTGVIQQKLFFLGLADSSRTGDYSITLSGIADSGSTIMIALNGGVATAGWYAGQLVCITGGTGAGQARTILEYLVDGTVKRAYVTRDWVTAPDNTSTFAVYAFDVPSILEAGTATGGGVSTITLDATAAPVNATYKSNFVTITGGTGKGQTRLITAYNGTTKVATISPNWVTGLEPDATSIYQVYPGGRVDVGQISGDATAADNLETMLDGTGGQTWSLGRLVIDGANSTNGSFYVRNTDGHATIFTTSSSGAGHAGLYCSATAGHNMGLYFGGFGGGSGIYGLGGSTSGSGITLLGQGGGHGLYLLGNAAGHGIYSAGGANGDGMRLLGQGTGKDLSATLDLNDVSGNYDKDDYEDDFFETVSDTARIRFDSIFTLANSLLAMIDGGNELVDLDTLLWIFTMVDSIRDSVESQGWAAVDACAGAGAYTCTLTVVDTTNDVTVSGVQITVNNQTEDGTEYYLTSNSNGHAVVSLNNGDYRASALGPPYIYASTDFTIDGAVLHDSILGYAPTISSPPSAAVATVYGYFISGGHDTLSNMDVTFELEGYATAIDTSADALVTAKIVRAVTDGNGKVEVTLLKNENLKVTDSDSLVYPWWTCKAADPTWEWIIYFTIDNDSTTFNLGVESDAVQFRKR